MLLGESFVTKHMRSVIFTVWLHSIKVRPMKEDVTQLALLDCAEGSVCMKRFENRVSQIDNT